VAEETLYFRQIHPSHVQTGVVSSEAFRPTEEHKWLLSLYDGSLIKADASWRHYTEALGKESIAVMALDSAQCAEVSLAVIPSPEIFPEHCHLDFTTLGSNTHKKTARKLRDRAVLRGFVFQPPLALD
jgi:hypothetical protein